MGKRIEDLHLNDSPIEVTAESAAARREQAPGAPPDDRDTPWYQFMGTIDDLLGTGEYTWAEESLSGIRETVETTRRVSDGQRNAVARIEAAGEKRRGGSRRYEGFGGDRFGSGGWR